MFNKKASPRDTSSSPENWLKRKITYSKTHQEKAFEEVNELVFKERVGRYITLVDDTSLIDFVSCSYLGLDLDERIINSSIENIKKCGVTFPAARTRIKANSFDILENLLNKIFCDGYSTTFCSLHVGHLGFIPLLGSGEMPSFPIKKGGLLFILDKTVHSSIQINRALMQQFGEIAMIDSSNELLVLENFQYAFRKNKTPIIIADSIGSMGGVASVKYFFKMAEEYDGYVYLDDAHGTSICGLHGCGYVLKELGGKFHPKLILASSLAKAFGAVAGVIVLPTKEDADMVKRFCPTYVFGGPPALAIIDAAIASAKIHLTDEIYKLQHSLWHNVNYFDSLMSGYLVNADTLSPIRGIAVGDEFKAIEYAKELRKCGFAVTTAMYPTVARKKSILRVALSAAHKKEDILLFCDTVKNVLFSHQADSCLKAL